MAPAIHDGDRVLVVPVSPASVRLGQIVKVRADGGFVLHRVVRVARRPGRPWSVTLHGDNQRTADAPLAAGDLVGRAVAVEHDGKVRRLDGFLARWAGVFRAVRLRARRVRPF